MLPRDASVAVKARLVWYDEAITPPRAGKMQFSAAGCFTEVRKALRQFRPENDS